LLGGCNVESFLCGGWAKLDGEEDCNDIFDDTIYEEDVHDH
jgi:hypothetical protein